MSMKVKDDSIQEHKIIIEENKKLATSNRENIKIRRQVKFINGHLKLVQIFT